MTDDTSEEPGYLGALFDEEQRLVLVPVDPEKPWSAFRRMRKLMKRSKSGPPRVTMFKAPPSEGKVIELPRPDDAD